jgi:uncharacterized alkaline shock family protein YloU
MIDAGSFKMRSGLLELIAGIALLDVEGAEGVGIRRGHPQDTRKRKNLAKGIRVDVSEGKVSVEMDVVMDYGKDFREVGRKVQEEVRRAVEGMTGWEVTRVDINVVGVNAG